MTARDTVELYGFRPVGIWPTPPPAQPFPVDCRWFWCPHCQVLYLGTILTCRQPPAEVDAAAQAHTSTCRKARCSTPSPDPHPTARPTPPPA